MAQQYQIWRWDKFANQQMVRATCPDCRLPLEGPSCAPWRKIGITEANRVMASNRADARRHARNSAYPDNWGTTSLSQSMDGSGWVGCAVCGATLPLEMVAGRVRRVS